MIKSKTKKIKTEGSERYSLYIFSFNVFATRFTFVVLIYGIEAEKA